MGLGCTGGEVGYMGAADSLLLRREWLGWGFRQVLAAMIVGTGTLGQAGTLNVVEIARILCVHPPDHRCHLAMEESASGFVGP